MASLTEPQFAEGLPNLTACDSDFKSAIIKPMSVEYEYIAYIDEAGDDGLTRVLPIDDNGASEWLVLSAYLIRKENENNVVDWLRHIRNDINARQGPALHYRNLSPTKRQRACELLSKKPARSFIVCSNKKNMRGWKNENAASRGGKQWFYNFLIRIIMERITKFCMLDSAERFQEPRTIKIVFSERGNHSYPQTKAYLELLRNQAINGNTYLTKHEVRHQTLRPDLVEHFPYTQRAGLQMADITASAFFQACNTLSQKWNVDPAKALAPIMAKENNSVADFGLVLQPTDPRKAKLNSDQKIIFKQYGYYLP